VPLFIDNNNAVSELGTCNFCTVIDDVQNLNEIFYVNIYNYSDGQKC